MLGPEEIKKEFKDLVSDPGSSRGQLTLYQKYLELQWSHKMILDKTLVEKDEQHGEILLQQHKMMLLLQRILDNRAELAKRLGIKLESLEQSVD